MKTTSYTNSKFKHFFITFSTLIKELGLSIKYKYFPLEEYQTPYEFNDGMRHCPKDADELILIYVTLHEMFDKIKDSQLFQSLIMEMQYANMPSCKTWSNGNIMTLPKHLDAPFSNVITSTADRFTTTYWVLWYKDDRVDIIQPHQNRGEFRTGGQIININDKPDDMPDNVVAAAQITLGVVQSDSNILRGFQWKLYR